MALAAALTIPFLACSAAPASAGVFVDVLVEQLPSTSVFQADNLANQNPPEKSVHGVADTTFGGGAFVSPGPAPSCDLITTLFGCVTFIPGSRAVGEVRGDLGRLKAQSRTVIDSSGAGDPGFSAVTVRLSDSLHTSSAGDVTFHLHLDVDKIESGLDGAFLEHRFELRFLAGASGIVVLPEFVFEIPNSDVTENVHAVIDETFVLPDLPVDALVGFSLEMHAETECSLNIFVPGGDTCSVLIDAGNTAYLGIEGDFISDSGYSYPGFRAAAAVPLPASLFLFLVGVTGVGALRIRAV
jgi:hypothetical protein